MDNQGNNMFSNMMQPSGVPDGNNNSNNFVQPSGVNNMVDNNANIASQVGVVDSNLNQVSNMVNSAVAGNEQNQNVNLSNNELNGSINATLNPVFPNEMGVNQPANNNGTSNLVNSNMQQQNIGSNVSSLDFVMPGEVNNSANGSFTNFSSASEVSNGVVQEPVINATNNNISGNGFDLGVSSSEVVASNVVDNNLNSVANVNSANVELNSNSLGVQGQVSDTSLNSVGGTSEGLKTNIPIGQSNVAQSNNDVTQPSAVNNSDNMAEVVSVKKYLGHFLILCIPVAGIVILIMRAFDKKDKNISNLAKAQLLLSAIFIGVIVVMFVVFAVMLGGTIATMFGMISNSAGQVTEQDNNNYYNDDYNYNIDEDDMSNDYSDEFDNQTDIDTDSDVDMDTDYDNYDADINVADDINYGY